MSNANLSQFLKAGGIKLEMSAAPSNNLDDSTGPFVDLAPIIKDFDYQGGQATEEEVTTLASLAKEFALGLSDAGSLALAGHFPIGAAGHSGLMTANGDKENRLFRVTFKSGETFACIGMVSQYTFKVSASGATVSATYNVRLTGAVKMTSAAQQGG